MSAWSDGMNEHDQLRELVVENARLRAEVERMRPVIEAARAWQRPGQDGWIELTEAIEDYDAAVAALDAGEPAE